MTIFRNRTDPPKLWQHRLWLHPTYNWQEVIVRSPYPAVAPFVTFTHEQMPIDDFTMTVSGNLGAHNQPIRRDEVSTIGMSVLGPYDGPFDLSIDTIEAVNIVSQVHTLLTLMWRRVSSSRTGPA